MISIILGKHLSQKDIVGGLTYIHFLAVYLDYVDENKLLENLAEYRSNEGFWALQFVQDCEKNPHILPLTYWKGIRTDSAGFTLGQKGQVP